MQRLRSKLTWQLMSRENGEVMGVRPAPGGAATQGEQQQQASPSGRDAAAGGPGVSLNHCQPPTLPSLACDAGQRQSA